MSRSKFAALSMFLAGLAGSAAAQEPPAPLATNLQQTGNCAAQNSIAGAPCSACQMDGCNAPVRGFLESDNAFPNFIGPMSNPILNKDPRSMTEARFLFINNVLPPNHH